MPTTDEKANDDGNIERTQGNTQRQRSSSPDGCIGMTAERGYYHCDSLFIKRSLRPSEYMTTTRGTLHIPRLGKERLQNEAKSLRFIKRATNIPIPTVYGAFEIDDSFYLITEYIRGVSMISISEDQKKIVQIELRQHLTGPSGLVIPPYRVMTRSENDIWSVRPFENADYGFCHNDLSQPNVIIDPDTLKIRAIIDWEYAGFWPEYFDSPFYERRGPSVPINGKKDDIQGLLDFLNNQTILC
ncbi:kinase-like domain-containing protein [Aspergillus californicus]